MATPLILKRAPIGDNQEDYDVLEDGTIVGRIFKVPIAPQGRPWMWASGHNDHIHRAAHGYEATREAAMAAPRAGGEPLHTQSLWNNRGGCPKNIEAPTLPDTVAASLCALAKT